MKKQIKAAVVALSIALGFGTAASFGAAGLAAAQPSPRLTMEDARRIALQYVPGARIESIELEYERGRMIYEVELRDPQGREHELEIDANDGTVLRAEIDD